jgi:fluoride exporter
MNFKIFLLIGIGGGIGSVARFACSRYITDAHAASFPWGTFLVNATGCLLIGIFHALAEKGNMLTPEMRLFLTAGFCGGFTTFSAFAYENIGLLKTGDFLNFSFYTVGSVVAGLAATYIGIMIIKLI